MPSEAHLVDGDVGVTVEVLLVAVGADFPLEVRDAYPPASNAGAKGSGHAFYAPTPAVGALSQCRHMERFADTPHPSSLIPHQGSKLPEPEVGGVAENERA